MQLKSMTNTVLVAFVAGASLVTVVVAAEALARGDVWTAMIGVPVIALVRCWTTRTGPQPGSPQSSPAAPIDHPAAQP